MHENGFKLAETQREMTPLQKYVYFEGRSYHFDDDDTGGNTNMNKLQKLR